MNQPRPNALIRAPRRPGWWLAAGWFCFLIQTVVAADSTNADWSLHSWQTDDGLPNNNVTSLMQTRDGYLWVATAGHFTRFDGVRFEEFASRNIITNYSGYSERGGVLLEDSKGGFWLTLVHGPVVCLNSGGVQAFTNNLPDYVVLGMVEDGEGAVWITYHGNVVCRIKDGSVTRFGEADGLPARYDCALARDNQGRIWFVKDGQFGVFRKGRFEIFNKTLGRNVRLAGAADGGIWVCSGRELFKSDGDGNLKSLGICKSDVSTADPTCLVEDKTGAVWIGMAASGLFRYGTNGFESIPTSHPYISSLLQDREGDLWVGTSGGGLDRIRPRAFTMEDKTTGLPFGAMQSVCEDAHGVVWATTQSGMVVCRSNGGWRTVSDATNWPPVKATCVTADRAGSVWVGTRSHMLVGLHDGEITTWRAENGFDGHVVRGLLTDTNDDLWIIEEDPAIVQCLHGGELKTLSLPENAGVPRASCGDTAGNIWIGTSKGVLLRLRNDIISDVTTNISGFSSSIRCLATTPDGSLWIGYAGQGLGRFKDGVFKKITTAQGLFNDDISQIIADERGWLWFGSDGGIFKARLHELNDVAEGRAADVLSVYYGKGNSLPSLQASLGFSPNVLHSHDDRLWLPALTGLAVVNLDNLRENLRPPPVLLKQVIMDDRCIGTYGGSIPVRDAVDLADPRAGLELPPGHRRLEFDFTALCYSAPENVHFQYRLAGYDDDWADAGPRRSIDYSRLAAGSYQFLVRARNGDSPWSETSRVNLVVSPFFWQTWWFRSLVLALFTLTLIAIVRYVSFRRLHAKLRALEQQAALDKERSRIAKDIHDDLGGSLTQIKLLFELTQRKRTEPDKVESLGREGLATTRQIIKSMDEIVWAVNPRNDSLPHLIDYLGQFAIEFLAYADIRCRVDLPDRPVEWAVSPEARHNLFLAVKEALNNVIRHAGASEVWLRVAASESTLTILIEDNGRGIAGRANDEFANGLSNMNQRMADIGGRSNIENIAETGTRVALIFPKPNGK
ncbi:MAG: two-component regulator propeller domain-containing protein [Verrucomicrobiae bacterium]|nr:two-component regulator propeller domain-containing protein [Verrucomicrobiae bacterium]